MKIENLKEASPKQVKALQAKALEILQYFQGFCNQYGLVFYICGGCCIGAIRHKGFIPWDDDIDVFMKRDDYEKLPTLWNKYADTMHYSYCRTTATQNYHNIGASIRDNNTTFINAHSVNDDINHGLQIDIIPLDVCPTSKIERLSQIFFAMLYSLYNAQRLPDNQGKLLRILSKVMLKIVPSKKIRYKIWSFAQKRMTRWNGKSTGYITEICSGFRYMKNKYPESYFSQPIMKEFENIKVPLPTDYDGYLKMAFGDYLTLPPKEKQIAKHNTVLVDLEHSYKDYQGIYYCK
ncbi:LicD family protein [Butyricicoccus intestinisimiae]|uniref:LicD family protein n=1 Tax=Butyricicoccus intestinisimiae TaxID=2841509 RepID=UPI003D8FDEB3